MSGVLDSIARLRRLVDALPTTCPDGAWLAAQLRTWLDGGAADGQTLEQALGVSTPRGARPWWALEAQQAKREAARRLIDTFGDASAAHRALRRYAAGRGRFATGDARYEDKGVQAAHEYLRAAGDAPDSARTLRRNAADRK